MAPSDPTLHSDPDRLDRHRDTSGQISRSAHSLTRDREFPEIPPVRTNSSLVLARVWDIAILCVASVALSRFQGALPVISIIAATTIFLAHLLFDLKRRWRPTSTKVASWRAQSEILDVLGTAVKSGLCYLCIIIKDDELTRLLMVVLVFAAARFAVQCRCKCSNIDNLKIAVWLSPMIFMAPSLGPMFWLLSIIAIVWLFSSSVAMRERHAELIYIERVKNQNTDMRRILHERQSELRAVFDNAAAGVVEYDLVANRITRVNQVFCHFVGRSERELLNGFNLSTLTYPEDRPAEIQRWAKLRETGESFHVHRRYVRSDGSTVWAHVSVAVFCADAVGRPTRVVSILQDMTERHMAEARIAHLAYHDPLTDLPNRALLRIRLDEALALAARGQSFALLCLDLDRFKEVNDTLGHPIGDALLRAVTDRLREATRTGDVVARLGGDEFAIVQRSIDTARDVAALAERLVAALANPFELESHSIVVATSIGIAIAPDHGSDHDTLLSRADMAMYAAKIAGGDGYRLFECGMDAKVHSRRAMPEDPRRPLDDDTS